MMPDGSEALIVLAPDVLARELVDTGCAGVLELWRDGRVRLVVTRALLEAYLRRLDGLGVPEPLLRRWALWFTAPEKVLYIEGGSPDGDEAACLEAARLGKAEAIVSLRALPESRGPRAAKERILRLSPSRLRSRLSK